MIKLFDANESKKTVNKKLLAKKPIKIARDVRNL
jgi:hypothetical protein